MLTGNVLTASNLEPACVAEQKARSMITFSNSIVTDHRIVGEEQYSWPAPMLMHFGRESVRTFKKFK